MKKAILLCGMLLAVAASVATAGPGVNLRWSSCFGDGGALNKAFTCNTNAGTNQLVGSFELAANMIGVSGNEQVIDLASASATLPAWWQFKNTGTCRQTALSVNFAMNALNVVCADWGAGQSNGAIGAYNIGYLSPNRARIIMASAVPPSLLQDLFAGTEYWSFNLLISNAKTVGTGACAGCSTPVCIALSSINVTTQEQARNRKLSGPTNGTDSNYSTWQGGGVPVTGLGSGCPAATPSQNRTWGQVKSLYR